MGFLVLAAIGLTWPHLVPKPLFLPGTVLFVCFLLFASQWVGVGGYRELGLAFHKGWHTNLLLGLGLGALPPLGLFLYLYATGRLVPLGWVAQPELIWTALFTLANTCYIGFWEELLNRGYLLRILPDKLSPAITLLIVGLVFSVFHIPRFGAPAPWWIFWFVSGTMFALPYLATGSLWFPAGLHWAFDLVWFYLLINDGLLKFNGAGVSAVTGKLALLMALLFLPVVWFVSPWLAKANAS